MKRFLFPTTLFETTMPNAKKMVRFFYFRLVFPVRLSGGKIGRAMIGYIIFSLLHHTFCHAIVKTFIKAVVTINGRGQFP